MFEEHESNSCTKSNHTREENFCTSSFIIIIQAAEALVLLLQFKFTVKTYNITLIARHKMAWECIFVVKQYDCATPDGATVNMMLGGCCKSFCTSKHTTYSSHFRSAAAVRQTHLALFKIGVTSDATAKALKVCALTVSAALRRASLTESRAANRVNAGARVVNGQTL